MNGVHICGTSLYMSVKSSFVKLEWPLEYMVKISFVCNGCEAWKVNIVRNKGIKER